MTSTDRSPEPTPAKGDRLPMGAPALMMSPQAVSPGLVRAELVHERDAKYFLREPEKLKGGDS
ncbi:hypothetical protein VIGAN_05060300 [Vigna angularis var. angularis]|uniref:Uncharacterized protein n=1 Tax=Vigna angularis var. angularis TaxID=157739 RepID=A0A0S3S334_PHAAN|nr:hypothetical protein VIGAN_05060300 [Vigna angularis var. angularis]